VWWLVGWDGMEVRRRTEGMARRLCASGRRSRTTSYLCLSGQFIICASFYDVEVREEYHAHIFAHILGPPILLPKVVISYSNSLTCVLIFPIKDIKQ
jgi:hypothetical protein